VLTSDEHVTADSHGHASDSGLPRQGIQIVRNQVNECARIYYYNLHCTIVYEMSYGRYSSLLSSFKSQLDGVHLLMRDW
jgi:hypothetical protein